MYFSKCPRCSEKSFERLKTHSYCVCCNYSPDLDDYSRQSSNDLPIPPWAAEAVNEPAEQTNIANPHPKLPEDADLNKRKKAA